MRSASRMHACLATRGRQLRHAIKKYDLYGVLLNNYLLRRCRSSIMSSPIPTEHNCSTLPQTMVSQGGNVPKNRGRKMPPKPAATATEEDMQEFVGVLAGVRNGNETEIPAILSSKVALHYCTPLFLCASSACFVSH